jgi:hypothetical protein
MKIVVTYEATDLVRLIRADLATQGIIADEDDIKFAKNKAVVSVEVTKDDAPEPLGPRISEGQSTTQPTPYMEGAVSFVPTKTPPPKLETIEGGANPADMAEILRASQKAASQNPGKFPTPERQLMDGESFDYPGDKR